MSEKKSCIKIEFNHESQILHAALGQFMKQIRRGAEQTRQKFQSNSTFFIRHRRTQSSEYRLGATAVCRDRKILRCVPAQVLSSH